MEDRINVLIASKEEDDRRRILAALPERMGFLISGVVKDESGAIIKTENLKPNILILDLKLSIIPNLELIRILRRRSPSTAIILLCDNNDNEQDAHTNLAFNAGVSGFLIKEFDLDKLADAVRMVLLNGVCINDLIFRKILTAFSSLNHSPVLSDQPIFSSAERSIINFLAQGFTDDQTAAELNLNIGSVRNCITEIRHKTNMKSRVEIVLYSLVSGLISPENLWIWKEKRDKFFEDGNIDSK